MNWVAKSAPQIPGELGGVPYPAAGVWREPTSAGAPPTCPEVARAQSSNPATSRLGLRAQRVCPPGADSPATRVAWESPTAPGEARLPLFAQPG